jgi:hypothetical protein
MTPTEAAIQGLHLWYCQRTKLETKLCFSQQLWFDRLRDYEFNAGRLREDCELIIRYLKREIARDKRNLGALKLQNFLQPDNFDSDLALAKLGHKKTPNAQRPTPNVESSGPEASDNRGAIAAGLRNFRESLAQKGNRE